MASNLVGSATDQNFESEVLKSDVPVLVDFWAEWCGPCRALAPTIDELAGEFKGQVKIMKMNVDENPGTPGQFSVRGIPTLILFKGGKAVNQIVGAQPKTAIADMIKRSV
jgi:thioredoxin 1